MENASSFDVTLEVHPERATETLTEAHFVLLVSLMAPFFEETRRAPIDIVLAIDRSGSMNEQNKMTLVKETLYFFVKQLKSHDRLGIVAYDDRIETLLGLTPMNSQGKALATSAVKSISPRGSTDLCGGLERALDLVKSRPTEGKNNVASVMLFTDGLANHGISKTPEILARMGTDLGCSVHAFGFGSDHDPDMLKAISEQASGTYFFLKDKDDIPDAFADCLGGLLSVVGQNVTITLEGLNGAEVTQVHTRFKATKKGDSFVIELGDIQSEEERDILATMKLPSLTDEVAKQDIARARMSYFNVVTSLQQEAVKTLGIRRTTFPGQMEINPKVDRQRNRIATATAVSEAKVLGDGGDLKGAREKIEEAIKQLQNSATKEDSYTKALISDLEKTLEGLQDKSSFKSFGYSSMTTMASAHSAQRSAGKTASPMYSTSSRVTTKSNMSNKQ